MYIEKSYMNIYKYYYFDWIKVERTSSWLDTGKIYKNLYYCIDKHLLMNEMNFLYINC